jgi:small redox-active disulfide protein 2
MKKIKILGTGCARCKATQKLVEETARELGVPITVEKVEEMRDIVAFHVLSTPGVVIDGEVVHAGGVPSRASVASWLRS